QDLQRELAKLGRAGVLVVAASKNNPADVDEVLERHPAMVLRRDDFAALRVSWEDKAASLRGLADELDLGLDSFVFLDDNPVERDWVRAALPEVLVPELPDDPVERPGFLRRAPWFRRISVTVTDASRTESYKQQSRRRELREAVASFDDFLAELGQEVVVEERVRERGVRSLVGRYVASPRNEQVRSFYADRSFEREGDAYRLDLERTRLEPPAAVAVKAAARA